MSVMHIHTALQPKMQSAPAVLVTITMVMDVHRIPVLLEMLSAHTELVACSVSLQTHSLIHTQNTCLPQESDPYSPE